MTKSQLKSWIAEGRIEEVLDALINYTDEALVVKANYMNVKRRHMLGTIAQGDMHFAHAKANESALYLINKFVAEAQPSEIAPPIHAVPNPSKTTKPGVKPIVFISYNHRDSLAIDQLQASFEAHEIEIRRDIEDMKAGEYIQTFITRMIKEKGTVVSVVSRNSLSSGWVGFESDLSFYAELLNDKKFIPVMLDNSLFDDDFVFEVVDHLDTELKELEEKIKKSKERHLEYDQFETKRKRIVALRQNLPQIINKLQSSLVVDVSGEKFAEGVKKVIETIKGL
jgi:hypothetical protein